MFSLDSNGKQEACLLKVENFYFRKEALSSPDIISEDTLTMFWVQYTASSTGDLNLPVLDTMER